MPALEASIETLSLEKVQITGTKKRKNNIIVIVNNNTIFIIIIRLACYEIIL